MASAMKAASGQMIYHTRIIKLFKFSKDSPPTGSHSLASWWRPASSRGSLLLNSIEVLPLKVYYEGLLLRFTIEVLPFSFTIKKFLTKKIILNIYANQALSRRWSSNVSGYQTAPTIKRFRPSDACDHQTAVETQRSVDRPIIEEFRYVLMVRVEG